MRACARLPLLIRNPAYTRLSIQQVEWRSNGDGRSMLIVTFSEPSNRPTLESGVALNNAILINHGTVQLQAGRGVWSEHGDSLTILDIDPESWVDIVASISNGSFHIRIPSRNHVSKLRTADERQPSLDPPYVRLEGNLIVRMSSPGQFTLHLHVGKRLHSSGSTSINVDLCPDEVEVIKEIKGAVSFHSLAPSSSIRDNAFVSSVPFFAVENVLAMSGEKWFKVLTTTALFIRHTPIYKNKFMAGDKLCSQFSRVYGQSIAIPDRSLLSGRRGHSHHRYARYTCTNLGFSCLVS